MAVGHVWRMSLIGSHSGTELAVMTMHIYFKTANSTFAGAALYLKTNLLDLLKTKQATSFRWDEIRGLTVNTSPPLADLYNGTKEDRITVFVAILFLARLGKVTVWQKKIPFGEIFLEVKVPWDIAQLEDATAVENVKVETPVMK